MKKFSDQLFNSAVKWKELHDVNTHIEWQARQM